MKKLTLLAIGGIFFTACTKQVSTNTQQTSSAVTVEQMKQTSGNAEKIRNSGGLKPVRGTAKVNYKKGEMAGWTLVFETGDYEYPLSLPAKYQVQDMLVDVTFVYSKQTIPCNCDNPKQYIDIQEIREIGSQPNF